MTHLRPLLTLLLAASLLPLWSAPMAASEGSSPAGTAAEAALATFTGTAGLAIVDPRSGAIYEHDSARIFPAASLYKLLVLVEVYRQVSAGTLSLDNATITIGDEDLVDGGNESGSGSTLSVREAVERMITVSDNSCARALLRSLDGRRVNATAAELGLRDSVINTELPADERTADFNTTSVRDMERLFAGLANGTVITPSASAEMVAILGRQRINDRLPSGVPGGTSVAHKTGNLDGIAHDAGIIATPSGPRVVVVLTSGFAEYAEVIALAGAVAHAAYALPLARFTAAITPGAVSAIVPLQPYRVTARVTNTSTFAWDPTFKVAVHWRSQSGAYLRWDDRRASLPPLAPGEGADVVLTGETPATSDPLAVLELDVVHEGVEWAGTPARVVVVFGRSR
jgi:beta-lactamase class A